ncbi:MAG: prolyl oligopeptidase family protein [Phycisphaerales bacterium JB043]
MALLNTASLAVLCCVLAPLATAQDLTYPESRRGMAFDELHGDTIPDPYRWMEDAESDEVVGWVEAQDDLFRRYVGSLEARDRLQQRIEEIGHFGSVGAPTHAGGRQFYSSTPAGASAGIISVREQNGESRTLVDPNVYFESQQERWTGYSPSPDGKLLVLGVDSGSGTWGHIRIIDVDTGEELGNRLMGTSGPFGFPGVYWKSTSDAFVYFHLDMRDTNGDDSIALRNNKIRMHHIGTTQADDTLVYARPDRPDMFINTLALSTDDRFVLTSIREKSSTRTIHYAIDLEESDARPIELADTPARLSHITNHGSLQLYQTDSEAPNGKIIAIDPASPEEDNWVEVIPEADTLLHSVSASKDYLIVRYDRDVKPTLSIYGLDGRFLRNVDSLPGIGGVGVTTSPHNNDAYYRFSVLFDPGSIFRLDLETGESELVARPALTFDPDDYVVKQVFYSSFDGTRIPMFIAHKRGLELNQTTPLWMYAFGHGGWVAFPWFQPHLVAWLELGGVYALPGIRGGGEYGRLWQDAGTGHNKPNTIGDYIAAGEWLVENGYTSPRFLVANGGSGSGPLPAIAVNQRPDLFGAAVVDFPFLDMMRYHLHNSGFTSGYGDPSVPADYEVLRGYSPYHNIRENECYPPVLVTVAEKDVSTLPFHCYKHVAALQHTQSCDDPILLQVIWGAGHYSYGTTREQSDESYANQIAFLLRSLGISMND